MKRLTEFILVIMIDQNSQKEISPLAHRILFTPEEQDTGVYAYSAFEEMEHHPEGDLVLKFLTDDGLKIFASWQGVSVTLDANLPNMGWDHENGEFGLGGDWWKR